MRHDDHTAGMACEVLLDPVVRRAAAIQSQGFQFVGLLDVEEYAAPLDALDAVNLRAADRQGFTNGRDACDEPIPTRGCRFQW